MNFDAVRQSLDAIQQYNPKSNTYLKVVGTGENQHLEVVKRNWLCRILMWLGFTSASMKKVADFVGKNIELLAKNAPTDMSRSSLLNLSARIGKSRHTKKMISTNIKIKSTCSNIFSVPIKPALSKQNPIVAITPLKKGLSLNAKTQDLMTQVQTTLKRVASLKVTPDSKAVPVVPLTEDEIALQSTIAYWVDSFKDKKDNPEDVETLLENFARPFKTINKAFSVSEMASFASIIEVMTHEDVSKYAALATLDVFKVKEGRINNPSLTLTVAISHMSDEKIVALAKSLSDSPEWENSDLQRAHYKIVGLLVSQGKEKLLVELFKQSRFFESIFFTPDKMPDPDIEEEKDEFMVQCTIQKQICKNALKYALQDKSIPMRDDVIEACWALMYEEICAMTPERVSTKLSIKEQYELVLFLMRKDVEISQWRPGKFIRTVLEVEERAIGVFKEAQKKDTKTVLLSFCSHLPNVCKALADEKLIEGYSYIKKGQLPTTTQKGNVGVAQKFKKKKIA